MELFSKLFASLLVFVYHCFDRIVIYGYLRSESQLRMISPSAGITDLGAAGVQKCQQNVAWRGPVHPVTRLVPVLSMLRNQERI